MELVVRDNKSDLWRETYPVILWEKQDLLDKEKGEYQQRYSLGHGYWAWCTLKRFNNFWSTVKITYKETN